MTRYVTYFRVSTKKQGKSGLGLAAQRALVAQFLTDTDVVIAEFTEVISGQKDDRTELWNAISTAKRQNAKLLIAKLDRFSRKVSFISRLMDEGIGLTVAEMPSATDFQLHIFAALAQEERRLISERTKLALAEAKIRGVELGKNGKVLAQRNIEEADQRAVELRPYIEPLLKAGLSLNEVARQLNARQIRAARGGIFRTQQVKNVVSRLQLDKP